MENERSKPSETFSYTYSAKQQAEIQAIRKKYLPREEDKLAQLRKLDEQPSRKACSASLVRWGCSGLPDVRRRIRCISMCCIRNEKRLLQK